VEADYRFPFLSIHSVTAEISHPSHSLLSSLRQRPVPPARHHRPSRSLTLEQCLNFFARAEVLEAGNEWYCPKCCEHVCANKKMDIWMVPPVLFVHLKRFVSGGVSHTKLDTRVEFPEILDMGPFVIGPQKDETLVYGLKAVSEHSGSLAGGHYTAHAMADDHKWYYFNDSSVTQASLADARCSEAYLIMYERIGEDGFEEESDQ
jgi:ubiquitin carboxyl-terminal hydrolase 4/11/15